MSGGDGLSGPGGVFITGTDTGVGKTVVAGLLARVMRERGINAALMKPVQTGAVTPEDAETAGRLAGLPDGSDRSYETHPTYPNCPYIFRAPAAPSVAARLAGREIDIGRIEQAYRELRLRHEFLLVEGAGGLAVPLTTNLTMRELAARLELPVVIVASLRLGTINHTLLTVDSAERAGLTVAAIVFNRHRRRFPRLADHSIREVAARVQGPLIVEVPYLDQLTDAPPTAFGALADRLLTMPERARAPRRP